MTLWRFELKKMLLTYKGLWIVLGCLILKLVFLMVFPELKDERIMLSQKQYDKYLVQVQGENTPEKAEFIRTEYENIQDTINRRAAMEESYQQGELSEEEWRQYGQELDQAYLRQNAAKIFAEKEEQFAEQDTSYPSAHYIYEYGWQTVFTLQMFPDIFLLFGVLLLTAQCFSAEASDGMLPVLLAARNGRRHLFRAKLSSLLTVGLSAALVSGVMEAVVFRMRGFCNDGDVPLYSISLFAEECMLDLSLNQGYLLSLGVRLCTTLLFVGLFFGVSVWVRNTTNLMFSAVCVLLVPLLLMGVAGAAVLFSHMGLLCGSRMLLLLGKSGLPVILPLGVVAGYSGAVTCLAERRHQKGL